jgi:hypothetical protein
MDIIEKTKDIYDIANEIFSEEPREANSIRLELLEQGSPAILYEILCILMCECLERKLPYVLQNNRNIDQFILTLLEYFHSFGMDFQYEILEDYNTRECYHMLPFQLNRRYNYFGVRSEYIYYDFTLPYEPDIHQGNSLEDFKLCIRIRNITYKITFKVFMC